LAVVLVALAVQCESVHQKTDVFIRCVACGSQKKKWTILPVAEFVKTILGKYSFETCSVEELVLFLHGKLIKFTFDSSII
jgi:hypothetical protein